MLYDADSLAALRAAGPLPQELSAFGDPPWLAIDLSALPETDAGLATWLRGLACPVIGVGPETPVGEACDLRLDDAGSLPALGEAIAANPVAAASFVQLLRVTEAMPVQAALLVESATYAALQGGGEYQRWLARHRADAPRAATDDGPAVLVESRPGTCQLTLNRPSIQNAMSVEMRDGLVAALTGLLETRDEILIQGRGSCFSTGGDLSEFGQVPDPATGHQIRMLTVPGRFLAMLAERTSVHVHGSCIGSGIEFPAFAGHIVASPDAWFCLPEVGMGLIPGAGGCISIARRTGRQRTAWLGLSGERITADTALRWGLVDRIDPALGPASTPPGAAGG